MSLLSIVMCGTARALRAAVLCSCLSCLPLSGWPPALRDCGCCLPPLCGPILLPPNGLQALQWRTVPGRPPHPPTTLTPQVTPHSLPSSPLLRISTPPLSYLNPPPLSYLNPSPLLSQPLPSPTYLNPSPLLSQPLPSPISTPPLSYLNPPPRPYLNPSPRPYLNPSPCPIPSIYAPSLLRYLSYISRLVAAEKPYKPHSRSVRLRTLRVTCVPLMDKERCVCVSVCLCVHM